MMKENVALNTYIVNKCNSLGRGTTSTSPTNSGMLGKKSHQAVRIW